MPLSPDAGADSANAPATQVAVRCDFQRRIYAIEAFDLLLLPGRHEDPARALRADWTFHHLAGVRRLELRALFAPLVVIRMVLVGDRILLPIRMSPLNRPKANEARATPRGELSGPRLAKRRSKCPSVSLCHQLPRRNGRSVRPRRSSPMGRASPTLRPVGDRSPREKFARDSALEGDGFELLVPRREDRDFRHTRVDHSRHEIAGGTEEGRLPERFRHFEPICSTIGALLANPAPPVSGYAAEERMVCTPLPLEGGRIRPMVPGREASISSAKWERSLR